MKISELSEAEGISANQFLVLAAAEKMSAILTDRGEQNPLSRNLNVRQLIS